MNFLAEIVNNKFSEIDVDKWDYILRDSYYLQHSIIVDKTCFTLYKNAWCLIGTDNLTHITYSINDFDKISKLFVLRFELHMNVYQLPTVALMERQLVDIFCKAEQAGFLIKNTKLSEAHLDLDVFKYLDDTVLQLITLDTENERLRKVQQYIKSLNERKLYKRITIFETKGVNTVEQINLNKAINELNSNGKNKYAVKQQRIEMKMPQCLLLHNGNGVPVNTLLR